MCISKSVLCVCSVRSQNVGSSTCNGYSDAICWCFVNAPYKHQCALASLCLVYSRSALSHTSMRSTLRRQHEHFGAKQGSGEHHQKHRPTQRPSSPCRAHTHNPYELLDSPDIPSPCPQLHSPTSSCSHPRACPDRGPRSELTKTFSNTNYHPMAKARCLVARSPARLRPSFGLRCHSDLCENSPQRAFLRIFVSFTAIPLLLLSPAEQTLINHYLDVYAHCIGEDGVCALFSTYVRVSAP